MADYLVPIAISSQLDVTGEERIHAANYSPTTRSTFTIDYTLILAGSGGMVASTESPFNDYTFSYANTGFSGANNAIAGRWDLVLIGTAFGRVLVSTDRTTYTSVVLSTANNIDAIAYGNGTFVLGAGNQIFTTTDGVDFTEQTSPFAGSIRAAGYGDGVFVLGGRFGEVAYSDDDGVTWTIVAAGFDTGSSDYVESIHHGNGLFVAAGTLAGQISTSPDGIVWTLRTDNITSIPYSGTYGNGIHIVVGDDGATSRSADGVTWTAGSIPGHSGFRSTITFLVDKFYATDNQGGVDVEASESVDGITWTSVAAPTESPLGSLLVSSV